MGESLPLGNACTARVAEVTVSARISKELEREVERLMREEHLDKSAVLRKLRYLGVKTYRLDSALRGVGEGRLSLSRAADEAGLTIWETLDEAARRRVTWIAEDVIENVRLRKGR